MLSRTGTERAQPDLPRLISGKPGAVHTTASPHAVWVLIERRARMPKLYYPKLDVVRASGPAREHGVEDRVVDRVRLQSTTPAKTMATAVDSAAM